MSEIVNVYILYEQRSDIDKKQDKINQFLSDNDYEVNRTFKEKKTRDMSDLNNRFDFIEFVQKTGSENVPYILFLNHKEIQSLDATTLDAMLSVANVKPLFVESDMSKEDDYGIYRAKQRAKEKEQNAQLQKRTQAKKKKKTKAPNMVYYPMEEQTYPAHPIDWSDESTIKHSTELSTAFSRYNKMAKLLAMPPGTGKTAVAVETLGRIQDLKGVPLNIVITAPAKVIEQEGWHKTIQSWNDTHPDNQLNPILITSVDKFSDAGKHEPTRRKLDKLFTPGESMIVMDEVHKYKNPTSKRSKQLQKFRKVPRLGLSATPITNNLILDMMSYLIIAGAYNNKSDFEKQLNLSQYKSRERSTEYLIYDQKTQHINTELWPEYHIMIRQMSDLIYRPDIDMSDLDMPDVTNHIIQLEATEEMESDMRSLIKAHRKRMFDSETDLRMELIRRLHYDDYRLDKLMEIVADENTTQPLIFYQNVIVQKYITDRLEKEGYTDYYVIAGGSDYTELTDDGEWKTYHNDHTVSLEDVDTNKDVPILIQYTSGSEGIEFKQSNTTVFYQNQHSYSILDQAKGRNRRLKMKHDIHHYYLVADHPYDQSIYDVVTNRAKVSAEKMDEIVETAVKQRYD